MWNIHMHRTFICIGIPKHGRLSLVQVRKVYWLLEFSLSTRGERETLLLLCWPFHLTPQTRGASRSPQTGLASPSVRSQLTAFFKNHQNSQLFTSGHDVIRTPVSFPIWGFYYDICDCHIHRARAWTPALNVCTCTCTKPNSSKPNQTEW